MHRLLSVPSVSPTELIHVTNAQIKKVTSKHPQRLLSGPPELAKVLTKDGKENSILLISFYGAGFLHTFHLPTNPHFND